MTTVYGWGKGAPTIGVLVGLTMAKVSGKIGDEELTFESSDGRKFRFYHYQDCCESCSIADIIGDLGDLVGTPIVKAEEVSSADAGAPADEYVESFTWTFYDFRTHKGTVTVRWLGESNGYYSEDVTFEEVK